MLPEKMLAWGKTKNCIRELTAYADKRKAEIGTENVFDFSLGNPSIPAPPCVNETILDLLNSGEIGLHDETDKAGLPALREKIAKHLYSNFHIEIDPNRIFVTCGAAAGLAISLRAMLSPGDEVITLTPFFPEYRVFVEAAGGVLVTAQSRAEDFQPDIASFERALSKKTKAVILNSPNNPTGVVLSKESIIRLTDVMKEWENRTGQVIYLICDEPYRELVYDGVDVPCVFDFYDNSVLCYSFSKSMSIPGERIGYLALNSTIASGAELYSNIAWAAKALGYEGPPVLFQRVVERCIGQTANIEEYRQNRDALVSGLREIGYECVQPQGAFYLFVEALEPDAKAFSERAKKHELILVPSDDFGCTGYVRIAYCVSQDTIIRSMSAFRALMAEYRS